MFGGPSGKLPGSNQPHTFSQIPRANVPRSAFDRSHTKKLTCQASDLVPIFLDEVLPGDTFSLNSTIFARLTTPLVPAMDNIEVTTQFFFCPDRLLWTNFVKMMGEQANPGDSIAYTTPQMTISSWAVMTLGDYFGLPPGVNVGGTAGYCSALPFRMYNRVWNDYYRDENIQNSVTVQTDDGPDTAANYSLLQRGKKKDYFYGALTAAQKGTAVPFLTGTANVYGTAITGSGAGAAAFQGWNSTDAATQFGQINKTAGALTMAAGTGWTGLAAGDTLQGINLATAAQYASLGGGTVPPYADLSTNLTDVVNTLRLAFQTQKFLERDARGGTRFIELILSHFGVTNPDYRLQRPEFLGGGAADLNITPIPQTTPTGIAGTTTKFGDLSAFGTALSTRNGFTKSFTEPGLIMGLLNIRVKNLTYQQGIHKLWGRQTRYDRYWPVFASLGEQTITRSEIYYVGDKASTNLDATVWGYQERWAEYRYKPSEVAGLFRSAASGTLDTWHFAQKYASAPSLNSTFLPDDSATIIDRNLAVTHSATVAQFKVDIFHKLHCARPMPVYSVPGNMDRF